MIRKPIFALAALSLMIATGPVRADVNDHAPLQDTRGGVVRNTFGNCVRTQWSSTGDECSPPAPPPPPPKSAAVIVMPPPPPPSPMKHTIVSEAARTVYFPFNKAGLTDEAKAQLDTLAETLKGAKDIQEAKIVGAADRIGSTSYNDKLSEKRAGAVRDYLIARGYANASVTKTHWVGKSEPVTSCSKKLPHKKLVACLQNDRRVQIDIVYKTEVTTLPPPLHTTVIPGPASSPTPPSAPVIIPAR